MDLISKHVDTCVIIGAVLSSVLWMNGKFNDVEKDISSLRTEMAIMRTEIAIMRTVLVMQKIMPSELAVKESGS